MPLFGGIVGFFKMVLLFIKIVMAMIGFWVGWKFSGLFIKKPTHKAIAGLIFAILFFLLGNAVAFLGAIALLILIVLVVFGFISFNIFDLLKKG